MLFGIYYLNTISKDLFGYRKCRIVGINKLYSTYILFCSFTITACFKGSLNTHIFASNQIEFMIIIKHS